MHCRCVVLAMLALVASPRGVVARTWYILNDGSGDAATVQAGIDSAAVGDTVLVGPGTYLENLSIIGKDLVLKSEMGPEVTILDGSSRQETVIYLSGQTRATAVEGLSITGGAGRLVEFNIGGGGLLLVDGASPVIQGNIIARNGVSGVTRYGGGIRVRPHDPLPSPLIVGNRFADNYADLGGGISLVSSLSQVFANEFRNNGALLDGGAIYATINSGSVAIEDNQFWENFARDHGGAVAAASSTDSEVYLVRNLFARNSAGGSSGFSRAGAAIWAVGVRGVIAKNTLVENFGPTWTSCGGGGLSLERTPPDLNIYANLIALNQSCGITCATGLLEPQNTLGENLLWMNVGGDLGQDQGACPSSWTGTQLIADPLFCDPVAGNYTVSIESPALTGSMPFGVWTTPGCGPGVAVQPTTWGRIKARYGSGDS